MRMQTMIGSCVAVVLAMTVVAAQQQPAGDDPQSQSQSQSPSRTSTTAGQPQEMTIVGCIEAQTGGAAGANDFVLVSAAPTGAVGASPTGVPSPTGTSGSTSARTSSGMRYSLSGSKERELRTGQRVEVIGKSSGAQNRGTAGSGSASTSSPSGTTRDTQPSAGAGDHTAPTPDSDRATDRRGSQPSTGTPTESSDHTASGARTDSGRQTATTGSAGANANMAMLEIVSYRVVPGNCNQ